MKARSASMDSPSSLTDIAGTPVWLPGAWRDQTAVVVFLRHLGCRFCMAMMRAFTEVYPVLDAAHVPLVAVSLGTPAEARAYVRGTGFPGRLLVDSSSCRLVEDAIRDGGARSSLYAAFRLKRQMDLLQDPRVAAASAAAVAAGCEDWRMQGAQLAEAEFPGDVRQLGGVFVMGPGTECKYAFRCEFAGHSPNIAEVLAAATGKAANDVEYVFPSTQAWADSLAVTRVNVSRRGRALSTPGFFLNDGADDNATWSSSDSDDAASTASSSAPQPVAVDHEPTPAPVAEPAARPPAAATPAGEPSAPPAAGAPPPRASSSSSTAAAAVATAPQAKCPIPSLMGFGPWGAVGAVGVALVAGLAGLNTQYRYQAVLVLVAVVAACVALYRRATSGAPPTACALPASSKRRRGSSKPPASGAGAGAGAGSGANGQDTGADAPISLDVKAYSVAVTGLAPGPIQFYTPTGVDNISMANGDVQCDCGSVVENIPVLGVKDPSTAAELNAPPQLPAGVDPHSAVARRLPAYQRLLCYAREFLAKPHPLVGRRGPVCPFVPVSLKRNALYFAVIHNADLVPSGDVSPSSLRAALVTLVRRLVKVFEGLAPTDGRYKAYKAIVLVFPEMKQTDAPDIIDRVQHACKAQFVRLGYMVGEFHSYNNSPGLRNDDFYPLRTPYPALAMRHMVPSDIAFLLPAKYTPSVRVDFFTSFLRNFGDNDQFLKTNAKEIDMARTALAAAEAEVAAEGA